MRPALIAVVLVAAVAPAAAQSADTINADRPGIADSSGVVQKGMLQIEFGAQWERRDGERSEFFPALFRVGVTDRFEARVEGNTFSSDEVNGVRSSGLGSTSIGFKYAFEEQHDRRPGVGVIARSFPAWGTGSFKPDQATADVRLAADWEFAERWTLNPNAGVGWYEGEPDHSWTALVAATLSYAPRPALSWFIDANGNLPEEQDGKAGIVADAGVAWTPRPNVQLDFSAGTRVHGDTPPQPFVSAGLAIRSRPRP